MTPDTNLHAASLVCLLASVSTPPYYILEGVAYFSKTAIDKTVCPKIIPNRDVIFELFTDNNPNISQTLLLGDDNSIKTSNFDFNNPTVFFFHGFLEMTQFGSADAIRKAYLKRGGHNIILVDGHVLLAGPWYQTAARNTQAVGKYTAAFIDYLVTLGLDLSTVHLIGHSLGSHSAGACGHWVTSGRIPRITGLDPALPLFRLAPLSARLDTSDAEFVDVIHTDAGANGFAKSIGHVDFYPNGGGKTQPGCTLREILKRTTTPKLETMFCNHWKSFIYYAESVVNPNAFNSTMANSWVEFNAGRSNNKMTSNMGYGTLKTARGDYFLKTRAEPPYSI